MDSWALYKALEAEENREEVPKASDRNCLIPGEMSESEFWTYRTKRLGSRKTCTRPGVLRLTDENVMDRLRSEIVNLHMGVKK